MKKYVIESIRLYDEKKSKNDYLVNIRVVNENSLYGRVYSLDKKTLSAGLGSRLNNDDKDIQELYKDIEEAISKL